jgi:uncharacterized NAD(P)/FAD-binding protein YdhS
MPKRIVIVGGGFCGTVLAATLLRRPPREPTEIVLVERGPAIGRGVAYAIHDVPYLLNVPAGRLSADSQDPMQFLRFAQQTVPEADAEDFLPRQMYGDYLQDFLARAEATAPAHVTLTRLHDEVTRISNASDAPLAVCFARREAIAANQVILALGNPPTPMHTWAEPVRAHPAYHGDPRQLPKLTAEHAAVVVGNGLTMADVLYSLSRVAAHTPRLVTISRRGLVSLPQATFHAAAVRGDGELLLASAASIRQVLRASRTLARDVMALGGDWREVVTFIRSLAPAIWQRLPDSERRRFLRHLQSHWDVHRHRLPPQMAAHIDELRQTGKLAINAGRIEQIVPEGRRLRVTWRPRGGSTVNTIVADAVVNATGPDFAIKHARDELLRTLQSDGWVCEDSLNLGLRTAAHGACVAADGRASKHLFYLGPMLRAGHWEATAATELRNHAEQLARHLVAANPDAPTGAASLASPAL